MRPVLRERLRTHKVFTKRTAINFATSIDTKKLSIQATIKILKLTGSSDFTLKLLLPVNWQQRFYVKMAATS